MTQTFEGTFTLPAAPDRVFAAFTQPDELRAWFAEHVEVEAKPSGAYRFWGKHTLCTPTAASADQTIETIEPAKALSFTWTWQGVPSRVELAFEDKEVTEFTDEGKPEQIAGCTLKVRHVFEKTIPFLRPDQLVDDHWRMTIGNLTSHLRGDGHVVLPDWEDPEPEVKLHIDIDAPPEKVFRALTEPDLLNRWLAQAAKVDLRVGGEFDLGWTRGEAPNTPKKILELVPNKKLTISWPDWRTDEEIPDQQVTFELEVIPTGTRVHLRHTGFVRVADRSDYQQGWVTYARMLKFVTEHAA